MQFQETDGRIWAEDQAGKLVAEITFPETRPGVADIDHTFVDASLRGQGAAGRLVEAAVAQLRRRDMKAVPTCSYAQRWFQEALRAEREGRAGPAGRISRAWLLSLGVSVGAVALGFLLLLCAVGAFYGAWTAAKAVFVLMLFAGLGPLGVCIRDLLRRKGPSRAANQVMFLVAAVAAALLYWWVKHQLLPF